MLRCQKHFFQLPEGKHYINCAYMAPLMKTVEEAGIKGMIKKRNPLSVAPSHFFEESQQLREVYSRLINNPEPNRIAIIPSVSYGIANVAQNIRFSKGDHIIVAGYQFPSNYYPWHSIAEETGITLKSIFPPEELEDRGSEWNERILENIKSTTRVVAISHCHWADGTIFNLEEIRKKLDEHGGYLVIDGTQSVGALPFDIQKIRPDALICAGYKWLMGPYAIGLAYYGERFDDGTPIEHNWINRKNSQDFANLVNYESDYQPGALRYEVGEHSNFILVPMMLEALKQIEFWGIQNIQDYCRDLNAHIIPELEDVGYFIEKDGGRGEHLYGIYLPTGLEASTVKAALENDSIYVSVRGASVRISPHVYNDHEDMAVLKDALLAVVK